MTGRAYDARLARRLLSYVWPHRRLAILALLLVFFSTCLFLVSPRLLGVIVDAAIRPQDRRMVGILAGTYLVVEILRFGVQYIQNYLLQALGQRVMVDLRTEVYRHLLGRSIAFFESQPVGRLVTRSMNDVETLAELFSTGVVVALGDLFLIAGITIVLLVLDVKLGLIAVGFVPVVALVTLYLKGHIREAFRVVRKRLARINATLAENLTGMKVVQLFCREDENLTRFEGANVAHLEGQLRSVHYHALFVSAITVLGALSLASIIWFGGGQVLQDRIALGVLVSFIAYVGHLYAPIQDIAEKYNIFQASMASAERIFRLLDVDDAISAEASPCPAHPSMGEVQFDAVWFAYRGRKDDKAPQTTAKEAPEAPPFVLEDVSFRVAPGETVALVGATGAGKSTIIKLLSRFYDVSKGAIRIDGRDIREMDPKSLRRHVGIVHQDVFLFSGNVLENVRLHDPSIPQESVEKVCRYLGAHPFIEALPNGYLEDVQERGVTLSAGQRQLLSFARALVQDPWLVVLDEATSNVDSETEATIQEALKKLCAGRTSIIIAHRLSTIQNADRIIVLHKGRVRQEGTHAALIREEGIYRKLYRLQFGPVSEEAP